MVEVRGVHCFVRFQGLFVYGRHRPKPMISLAEARARVCQLSRRHRGSGDAEREWLCRYSTSYARNKAELILLWKVKRWRTTRFCSVACRVLLVSVWL
jgi:hypothetical protein